MSSEKPQLPVEDAAALASHQQLHQEPGSAPSPEQAVQAGHQGRSQSQQLAESYDPFEDSEAKEQRPDAAVELDKPHQLRRENNSPHTCKEEDYGGLSKHHKVAPLAASTEGSRDKSSDFAPAAHRQYWPRQQVAPDIGTDVVLDNDHSDSQPTANERRHHDRRRSPARTVAETRSDRSSKYKHLNQQFQLSDQQADHCDYNDRHSRQSPPRSSRQPALQARRLSPPPPPRSRGDGRQCPPPSHQAQGPDIAQRSSPSQEPFDSDRAGGDGHNSPTHMPVDDHHPHSFPRYNARGRRSDSEGHRALPSYEPTRHDQPTGRASKNQGLPDPVQRAAHVRSRSPPPAERRRSSSPPGPQPPPRRPGRSPSGRRVVDRQDRMSHEQSDRYYADRRREIEPRGVSNEEPRRQSLSRPLTPGHSVEAPGPNHRDVADPHHSSPSLANEPHGAHHSTAEDFFDSGRQDAAGSPRGKRRMLPDGLQIAGTKRRAAASVPENEDQPEYTAHEPSAVRRDVVRHQLAQSHTPADNSSRDGGSDVDIGAASSPSRHRSEHGKSRQEIQDERQRRQKAGDQHAVGHGQQGRDWGRGERREHGPGPQGAYMRDQGYRGQQQDRGLEHQDRDERYRHGRDGKDGWSQGRDRGDRNFRPDGRDWATDRRGDDRHGSRDALDRHRRDRYDSRDRAHREQYVGLDKRGRPDGEPRQRERNPTQQASAVSHERPKDRSPRHNRPPRDRGDYGYGNERHSELGGRGRDRDGDRRGDDYRGERRLSPVRERAEPDVSERRRGFDEKPPALSVPPQTVPAAPVNAQSSADIVRAMMGLPSLGGAPGAVSSTLQMTREQKLKLLWGSKKQEQEKQQAAAMGSNHWEQAEFQSQEEKIKFAKLMGVKGDVTSIVAQAPKQKQTEEEESRAHIMTLEEQKKVLTEVEQQFMTGLRRADGRTVGLGL